MIGNRSVHSSRVDVPVSQLACNYLCCGTLSCSRISIYSNNNSTHNLTVLAIFYRAGYRFTLFHFPLVPGSSGLFCTSQDHKGQKNQTGQQAIEFNHKLQRTYFHCSINFFHQPLQDFTRARFSKASSSV